MAGRPARGSGIIKMLKEDHRKVQLWFEAFESAEGREQADLAAAAIMELEAHADVEDNLIYPAIRKHLAEAKMMNKAEEEHHLVQILIKKLKKLKPKLKKITPKDEVFQAKFKLLGELVQHHIEEEEEIMLPKAKECAINWKKLETAVRKRREKLSGHKKARRVKRAARRAA